MNKTQLIRLLELHGVDETTEWKESFFELSNGTKFSIVHNMTATGEINSPQAALDNWLARTSVYTQKSFIQYINSKHVYFAMTKEDYELIDK